VKLLLDTHAFLWFIAGDSALSQKCRTLIEAYSNQKYVNIASVTEIAIKTSLGKLSLEKPFVEIIPQQLHRNNFHLLPFTVAHAIALAKLPFYHRDPFDRMIVAQSLVENFPVLSKDSVLDGYSLNRLW
jgi:PIN domain nuclease of toxin-antitoxin system